MLMKKRSGIKQIFSGIELGGQTVTASWEDSNLVIEVHAA